MDPTTRRYAPGISAVGTIFIGLLSFWLSFVALASIARESAFSGIQAYAWPLIVDGLILIASITAFALEGAKGRWFAWMVLVAGAVVSLWGNGLHAWRATESTGAVAASLVPPIALLIATRLTETLIRARKRQKAPEPPETAIPVVEAVEDSGPGDGGSKVQILDPWPDLPEPPAATAPAPAEPPVDNPPTDPEKLREYVLAMIAEDPKIANTTIAKKVGKSEATIRRWRTAAQVSV